MNAARDDHPVTDGTSFEVPTTCKRELAHSGGARSTDGWDDYYNYKNNNNTNNNNNS